MKPDKDFKEAIQKQNIPLLVLDNKWHQLTERLPSNDQMLKLKETLNDLIKQQAKASTELKQYKQLKKKLMDEIVSCAGDAVNANNKDAEKILEKNKRYIDECNEKMEQCEDQLIELPREIDRVNRELMLATMEISYETMKNNESMIDEIGKWITGVRIELKKKLIRKQEKELTNKRIYAFMHNVFGPEVIDLFDIAYAEEEEEKKPESEKKES